MTGRRRLVLVAASEPLLPSALLGAKVLGMTDPLPATSAETGAAADTNETKDEKTNPPLLLHDAVLRVVGFTTLRSAHTLLPLLQNLPLPPADENTAGETELVQKRLRSVPQNLPLSFGDETTDDETRPGRGNTGGGARSAVAARGGGAEGSVGRERRPVVGSESAEKEEAWVAQAMRVVRAIEVW